MKRNNKGQFIKKYYRKQELIKCECGCGEKLYCLDSSNRLRKFICGHHSRVNHPMKGKQLSEEAKVKMSKRSKKLWENLEWRKNMLDNVHLFSKDFTPWNKGLKGKYKLGPLSKEHKINISLLMKKLWENEEYRKEVIKRSKKLWENEDYKKMMGNLSKKRWEDNNYRTKMIKAVKKSRAKQKFPVKDTKIELKIQDFLTALKIEFVTHKYMNIKNSYQCDILIPIQKGIKQKTIIECDGDFYHMNPNKFSPEDKIFKNGMTAKEKWKLDENRTNQLIKKGFKVLRLWECEIKEITIDNFNIVLKGGSVIQ